VRVLLYREFADEELWDTVGWAVTDEGGGYVVSGLTGGDYVVEFRDPNAALADAVEDDQGSQAQDPGSPASPTDGESPGDPGSATPSQTPTEPAASDGPAPTGTSGQDDPTPPDAPETDVGDSEPSPTGSALSPDDPTASDATADLESPRSSPTDSQPETEVVGGGYVAVSVETGGRVVVPRVVLYPELSSGLPDGEGPEDVFAVPFDASGVGDPLGATAGVGASEGSGRAAQSVSVVPAKATVTAKKGKPVVLKVKVKGLPAGSQGKVVACKSGKKVASVKVSGKGTVKLRVKAKYLSQPRNKLVLRFEGTAQSTSAGRTVVVRVK
jgi:hypothetical protein